MSIVNDNNFIIGHLKKQFFLYKIQKEKGKSNSFVNYLISKIRLKLNLWFEDKDLLYSRILITFYIVTYCSFACKWNEKMILNEYELVKSW